MHLMPAHHVYVLLGSNAPVAWIIMPDDTAERTALCLMHIQGRTLGQRWIDYSELSSNIQRMMCFRHLVDPKHGCLEMRNVVVNSDTAFWALTYKSGLHLTGKTITLINQSISN